MSIDNLTEKQSEDLLRMNEQFTLTALDCMPAGMALPPVRGFVRSEFNPLIYHSMKSAAAAACLNESAIDPARRGVLLGSLFTDAVTEQETLSDVLLGKKVSPVLFPPSVPSAVIGYAAKELAIHGPMSCMGATTNGCFALLLQAADWLEDGDADIVLLTFCDVPSIRSRHWTKAHCSTPEREVEFGGGAISVTMEPKAAAAARGAEQRLSVRELYESMSAPLERRFHGMASGIERLLPQSVTLEVNGCK